MASRVVVSGRVTDASGVPVTGRVVFWPAFTQGLDDVPPVVVTQAEVSSVVAADGSWQVSLVASDDPGWHSGEPVSYLCRVQVVGWSEELVVDVPGPGPWDFTELVQLPSAQVPGSSLDDHVAAPDPHPQYLTESEHAVLDHSSVPGTGGGEGGITVHAQLGGLGADDHVQYALADGTRGSFAQTGHAHTIPDVADLGTAASWDVPLAGDAASAEVVIGTDSRLSDARTPTAHVHAYEPEGAVADHVALPDPHAQYLTGAEGDSRYDPIGASGTAITDHEAAPDPHSQYLTETEGDARYINASGDTMTGRFTAGELEALNGRNDGILLFPWGDASAQCAIYPVVGGVNGNGMVYYGGLWHIPAVADPVADGDAANKAYVDTASASAVQNVQGVAGIWRGTQAAYDAIGTPDPNTLYVVVG